MSGSPLHASAASLVEELDLLRVEKRWERIAELITGHAVLLETGQVRELAAIDVRLAQAYLQLDDVEAARMVQHRCRQSVSESGSEATRAQWDLNASVLAFRSGDLNSAEQHAYACLASSDLLRGVPALEGPAHNNIGLVSLHRGDWSVAKRHLLSAVDLALRAGDLDAASFRRLNYSLACFWNGDWAAAKESALEALEDAETCNGLWTQSQLHILLGTLDRLLSKTADCRSHLSTARALATSLSREREIALTDELEGDLALDAGNLDAAATLYARTVDAGLRIAPRGDLVYEGKRKLADVRRLQGRYAEALELAQDALTLARAAGTVVEIGATLRVLALTHEVTGNRDEARTHATEGITLLREVHERYELMQTLVSCAEFLDDTPTLLVEARGLAVHLGLTQVIRAIDERLTPPAQTPLVGGSGMTLVASDPEPTSKARKPLHLEELRITTDRVFLTTDIRIVADVRRAMRNQDRVLIEGETGTGKELVARLLHENSPRKGKPFICVECTSLHESLAQSELFGHAKGSFTGAHTEGKGLVDAANGGTLFLDEVGDLSPALQGRLLRLLQEREFRPVGSASAKAVDLFVISATNRDLVAMVDKGEFRRDLYYRIKGAMVRVPPLRERPDDILALADYFLRTHGDRRNRRIELSPQVRAIMRRYAWPGNARQLENEIDNIVSQLEDGATADTWVLSPEIVAGAMGGTVGPLTFKDRVDALIVSEVQRCLRATGGNRARTADLMGFSRRGLQKMLKRLGLVGEPGTRADAETEPDEDSEE